MFEQNSAIQNQNQGLSLQKHAMKTFSIMGLGLLITAVIAFFCYESGFALRALLSMGSFSYLFLILIEFGVVIAFSKNLYNMNYTSAMVLFAMYCAITGFTFSTLGYAYDAGTIFFAFGVTAVYFGSLTMIGFTTKADLTKLGTICFTGLIVLILVEVIGIFFLDLDRYIMMLSGISILIFTGLTAYDVQKLKNNYYRYVGDGEMLKHLALYSAFELYLDFINLFLRILTILGNRND